jgi:putative peptide modification system cyclase
VAETGGDWRFDRSAGLPGPPTPFIVSSGHPEGVMSATAIRAPKSPVGSSVTPVLRAVLLADLVDSTAFIERFGDAHAAAALQRLDLQIRDLLDFTGGRLIDKADGLLAIFERPIQAVDFALRYQQALRQFDDGASGQLQARVGIHVGELMTWRNTDAAVAAGAKPLEVEGLAKPVAARLMALALPGQILVSSMAQTLAQRAQAELGERAEKVRWLVHGRYRFKGVPAPLLVHEVGELGHAPLKAPGSGQKAWRELPFWRKPPVLAAEVLMFLVLAGFYGYSVLRSPPALAFHQRDWVVIGDLNNFTGDPRFEDAVETALRISLEQSRHVNVVPDSRVNSVLQRMGRGKETAVDRAVGSEIATREGAKALLLPSVADIGGRLRVSIEVVDPSNQASVFAETADGNGAESLLASLDEVNVQLREALGESMKDIRASGKPLAQITTSSLEALRLYTLANEAAIRDYRFDESMRLLNMALREDPGFAMAYTARARLHIANSELAAAKADFARASRLRHRLSAREALTLDTGLAEFGPPQARIDILRLVSRVYPDIQRAHYLVAYNLAFYMQQYAQALDALKPAMDNRNPRLSGVLHLQGVLLLGLDRVDAAKAAFVRAESLGSRDPMLYHANAHAVGRDYAQAARLLAKQVATGAPASDLDNRLPEISYPVDRGDWEGALAALRRLEAQAKVSPVHARTYRGMRLGLLGYADAPALRTELQAHVGDELARATRAGDPDAVGSTISALYAGVVAARIGDLATARRVEAALRGPAPALGYPAVDDLLATLRAELALASGGARRAVADLAPRVTGSELNIVHATLLRAHRRAGQSAEALREAEWLAAHRGRAYTEWNNMYLVQPANLVETNLALLSAAEIARERRDVASAALWFGRFESAWPSPPPFVAKRVGVVRDWLRRNTGRTGQTPSPTGRPPR